jgi:translation initiation factor IF-1
MSLRNIYGGNKAKSKKRCRTKQQYVDTIDDDALQMYGQMIECKGGLHFKILGSDNKNYLGRLCNKMKKGKRLSNGMYVVISLREFESDKKTCDIIALANPPSNIIEQFKINNPTKYNDIVFCDSDEELEENNEFTIMTNADKIKTNKFKNSNDILHNNLNNNLNNSSKNNSNISLNNMTDDDIIYDSDSSYEEIIVKKDKFGNDIIDDSNNNENNLSDTIKTCNIKDEEYKQKIKENKKPIKNTKLQKVNLVEENELEINMDELNFDDI